LEPAIAVGRVKQLLELEPPGGASAQPLAEEVLDRLARAGRFRDEETAEHVERMSRSCALIARGLGWKPEACSQLRAASAMHDIGKVGVPDSVLRKPGKLAPDERLLIEAHAQIGHDILAGSDDEVLDLAATVALTHHERFDGTGYPHQLEGEAIPPPGRVAAVADVFDALTHDRIYRGAFSLSEALEIMRDGRGTHFDPAVLEAFEAVLPEIEQVGRLYEDSGDRSEQAPALFAAPERPTRVLIVEDHEAIARGLELLLRREGIEIAGSAGSLADAARLLERREADVVVLDLTLQGEDGLELLSEAKAGGRRVLLYTGSEDPATVAAARAAGADGVASKTGTPAEFVEAVRAVARGDRYMDPRLPRPPEGAPSPIGTLTAREREVVALLAEGLTGDEIGERLFLSPATVRTHLRNAMDRIGARNRPHLVALATATDQISADS
jgi:response regulator RpfG family c-di-GMP phosphodiesterase/DNA-binding CsgD family transcriptional regulator